MFSLWTVSLNRLAVICHHIYIPYALILLFHHFHILEESFTFFITYIKQNIRESVQETEQKMNRSGHIAAQVLECFQHICDVVFVAYRLFLAKKVINDCDKHIPCSSLQKSHWLSKIVAIFHFTNLGTANYASLQFFLTKT